MFTARRAPPLCFHAHRPGPGAGRSRPDRLGGSHRSISLHWPVNTLADSSRLYSPAIARLTVLMIVEPMAAVVLELLGAVVDRHAGLPADEFIIRALIGVLEPAPPTDIIGKDDREIGAALCDVINQRFERIAAVDIEPALSLIGIGSHNIDTANCRVPRDDFRLVFRRIFLMFRRHAHVLRRANTWSVLGIT